MKLTVQEKILLHLYRCARPEGGPDGRQTRFGLAKACGTSEDFVGGELPKLMRMGWVEETGTARHERTGRLVIAYSLTRQGEYATEELIREIVALHNKVLPLIKTEVR